MATKKARKLNVETFVHRFIELKTKEGYTDAKGDHHETTGIHLPYSKLYEAMRAYYGGKRDAQRPKIDKLVEDGKFVTIPAKGGVMLHPAEAGEAILAKRAARSEETVGVKLLKEMGLTS